MAESNLKYQKRVIFKSKNQQCKLLAEIQEKLDRNNIEMAALVGMSVRSWSDWKRGENSVSLPSLKKLCKISRISFPTYVKIENPFWYTSLGSSLGGKALIRKYGQVGGDPEYRKQKWREWWEIEGRFKKHPIINVSKPLIIPKESSLLAEFIGVILGDGGITERQIVITLHKVDDLLYTDYVSELCNKLFEVKPSIMIRKNENVNSIIISRTELVRFLLQMGLVVGSKVRQQVQVPDWIKNNDSYSKCCLRGLFDTDGCFYVDKHIHKNKTYYNGAMNFTNRSKPLLSFFKNTLNKFGFHPTQRTSFSIFLRREDEIVKYFKIIRTSNMKHLNKAESYWKKKYGEVPKWS